MYVSLFYGCTIIEDTIHVHVHVQAHTTGPVLIARVLPESKVCYMYRIVQSKRPPPFFDDPMVRVYMRYTYKRLVRVNAHPVFWPVNSSAHGRLNGRLRHMYMPFTSLCRCNNCKCISNSAITSSSIPCSSDLCLLQGSRNHIHVCYYIYIRAHIQYNNPL